ncbi:PREDICTED: nesprin-1 [Miniopterus natalensis]|uniref:nesprin-1 n=1 Tax=Miniopterus natalensis TaxID=291302 RepID=UPI0007A6B8AD|nr:PREDICTED: nesprin-1 [Miniopterus natalensis]
MAASRTAPRSPRDIANVMQRLQDEQELVQKRTFTKWINSHLAKRKPPLLVEDLFEDMKDGVKLLALLEVLSGQKLPCEQGRRMKRIHAVANIGTALKFLEGRKIKLVNINSTDIADGRPSIVLGLVWTIILYFQIEELTSNLPELESLSSSTSSVDSTVSSETASPPSKRKVATRTQGNAKKALLKWAQHTAAKQTGIEIKDFGRSWRNGVAFHSVIHAIRPELVDLERVKGRSNRENLEEAFTLAETELGIPRLLDPEDVDVDKPDEKSIMTYVAQFLKQYPDIHSTGADGLGSDEIFPDFLLFANSIQNLKREDRLILKEMKVWIEQFERDLTRAQMTESNLQDKYQSFKHFRVQYEMKRKQIEHLMQPLQRDGKLSLDQALVKQAWDRVSSRLFDWHIQLDKSLPAPLGTIGAWLYRAEVALREEISIQQVHEETADTIQRKREQHKDLLQNTDAHKRAFHEIYRTRSVNGIPVPPDQLEDMAERFHFVSSTSELHLMKMEFLELKYRLLSLLVLAESKLKSWIIKYGRRDSVELLLESYIAFIENSKFFEQYEVTYQILKQTAEMYVKADGSVEEAENVMKFMSETTAQWRNLSVEVRSVRSMLEEVIANWDRYGSTVATLQAWLEDAEKMLNQSEHAKKDFFRNLPHWIQQHTAMNDAGNFLIETCDEVVSRDLKQQLLLLNGRWRELFMEVKQYARADEMDRMEKEYTDCVAALSDFTTEALRKLSEPLEVSFINVKLLIQDLEDIEQRIPVMDAQYKIITKTAHLITKESSQETANEMLATMSGLKEQLTKVKERYSPLLYESQQLSTPLEELEKQMTSFYDSLGKISEIITVLEHEAQSSALFKQKHQELLACQESCKKTMAQIEKGSQNVQKFVTLSHVLKHFDQTKLLRQTAEVQVAFQNMVKKTGDWKKHVETNSRLMEKFEESRAELEKVLRMAQEGLEEKGDPEDLLRRHTEFYSQLDQRVLNAFLKACDELTDILPEQEQQGLQEAVRKLHKQWKDLQGEAPYHLLHLKIEVEKRKFLGCIEECRAELDRETALAPQEGSEKMIKEHRIFFSDKGPHHLCEKRLQLIEELCLKLPVRDPVRDTPATCQATLRELRAAVEATYAKLVEDPDKWKDYAGRVSELSSWISAKETQLKGIKDETIDAANHGEVTRVVAEIRNGVTQKGETLSWLKSRLKVLLEVSSEKEAQKQGDELAKLSGSFKALTTLLSEVEKMLTDFGDCVQYKEIVKSSLEELISGSKDAEEQAEEILDAESLFEAQQLLLRCQQKTKGISAKKRDVRQQMAQAGQGEGGLPGQVQEELRKLEGTLAGLEHSREKQERRIQVTLRKWERFETNKETVVRYLFQTGSSHERFLSFSSLESLSSELEQTKEFSKRTEDIAVQAENLVKEASEIPLGPKNKRLLQQQAKSIKEQVTKLEATLEEDIKTMEMVKNKWDHFGNNFETLSVWITEKEKELDALETSPSAMDMQISQIKVTIQEIESKVGSITELEEAAQSFAQFITTGESARIKAKLTQLRRYWEELREHAQGLEGTILAHLSQQQKFEENLRQIQQSVSEFEDKLADPIKICSSATETYKALQEHMDLCQALESLAGALAALSACAQKVAGRDCCAQEAAALQQSYEGLRGRAKDRQAALEQLLAHWQRLEKELSSFLTWLERCEAIASSPETDTAADRAKAESELQLLQALQSEVVSQASIYSNLLQLKESLFSVATKDDVKMMKLHLEQLDERWSVLPQILSKRIHFLQSVVAEHQQFDELLLSFSVWIKQFLGELQTTSEISLMDHQAALTRHKDHAAEVESKSGELQSLQGHLTKLGALGRAEDRHLLQGRADDCFQLFEEARQVVAKRQLALSQLAGFLQSHTSLSEALHRLRQTVEATDSMNKKQTDLLEKELSDVIRDVKTLESAAIGLDGILTKAQYHLKCGSPEHRTSCRATADHLCLELERIQNLLGTKQSEADALAALKRAFQDQKEELLKSIEDIEERTDRERLKEPTRQALQQRLRVFNQLEDELNSHEHELCWLKDKAKQIAQKDVASAPEVDREINRLEVTWDDTKKLIHENQGQCCGLIDLMREYQSLKSAVLKILENASNVIVTRTTIKDEEDLKWALSKHETARNEMCNEQKELDNFTSKGKQLLSELKKIHSGDFILVKTDMESTVDRWLDVSERIEENIDRLKVSLSLWADVLSSKEEIEGWSSSSVPQLAERVSNLGDSLRAEGLLKELESEVKNKALKLEDLHSKVNDLKELTKNPETPPDLQFIEADLRQKLEHAKEITEEAKGTLKDFRAQSTQVENFVNDITAWLTKLEESLENCAQTETCEGLKKVKEIQKELQSQQSNISSTQENLNSLCRKYHSAELERLGGALTGLTKKHEAASQLCSRAQAALQESLEKHFHESMQEFQEWFSGIKAAAKESSDRTGDSKVLEAKLRDLQSILDSVSDGQSKLDAVTQEGQTLYAHLPKQIVSSIQEQITKANEEFQAFLKQCLKDKQALQDCALELGSFEDQHRKLNLWIHEMNERLSSENSGESKQYITEKKNEVHRIEMFLGELLAARESLDKLSQRGQLLSEEGHGAGKEGRLCSQLLTNYQGLVRMTKEKLRGFQVALQEHEALEEALQSMWAWVRGVQDKLACADSTVGSRDTLEKRLLQIQDILLMRGEGEVKLNMAIGKGEQALRSSNEDGQKAIQTQLQTLTDVWANIMTSSVNAQSTLESVISQWNDYLECKNQLEQWMESVDQKVEHPLKPQPGLKEKFSLLDHFQSIVSEGEDHTEALNRLTAKSRELYQKTEDATFREAAQEELKTQFNDIMTVAKDKMRKVEEIVKDHLMYLDAVQEFTDWLHSAKEELHRWSDMSGDSSATQKKLSKIKALMDSRETGAGRLSRVECLAPAVKHNTTAGGSELMDTEMQALRADWKQWEDSVFQAHSSLENLVSQMALSEQEFSGQVAELEQALGQFSTLLTTWAQQLALLEGKNTDKEVAECWAKGREILDALQKAEPKTEDLKSQLNELCRFSRDLSPYSGKVSALIKEYNCLCLQASKSCQNKEQILQQRFRRAFKDFQQWLVNAKITTAKCFDIPQNISEVSTSLQKIQEFSSESENGQHKLNMMLSKGELLSSLLTKEKANGIQAKITNAKEDWKNFHSNLHQKESTLENLKIQMKDFEVSAEPVQDWLSKTEKMVHESSSRLYDLPAKRREQQKLQSVLEEINCYEPQLNRLKEKAQQLWEGQAASKSFVHRVSQLSAQYLALSNVTKEKVSRLDRIVAEHNQFSLGVKELQDWMTDVVHMLDSYSHPTSDKSVLDSRMLKLEALLSVKQEKEIQLKMIVTRGESVLQSTAPEGIPALQQQLQSVKDMWASLLSAVIRCKSQLEGALSKWTSYQDDVRQFSGWMDGVEAGLNEWERPCAELRGKTAALGKAKLLTEEVLSHSSLLETIEIKGASMTEHYVTQLELQDLQERYRAIRERAKEAVTKSEKRVRLHQEYQRDLKAFEVWLGQELEKLEQHSVLQGDTHAHETTLRGLQELQVRCAEGQALLNSALHTREEVIPSGIPQTEDRALESLRQDWQAYQQRLSETRTQFNSVVNKLRLMEQKFQQVDDWLQTLDEKVRLRTGRQSNRAAKETQLHQMKKWHEEITTYRDEVEDVGARAQEILDERHVSSRLGCQATQLTSRYQTLLLQVLEQIKFLEEEIQSLEEAESSLSSYSHWYSSTYKNFKNVAAKIDKVDKAMMGKKMKTLEGLLKDMEKGHSLLKSAREKGERALAFLEDSEADTLRNEIHGHVEQLNELTSTVRKEHMTLEKGLHLAKEFSDKYKALTQWIEEYQEILQAPEEPKMELYEKKAQLSKYKSLQQIVLSHEPSVKSVREKGDALLELVQDATLKDKIEKLQSDYQGLCSAGKEHVHSLEVKVKDHEDYNSELQEVEKWLLQMSGRLVAPDLMETSSLETITQQLAHHKAMMEEIAGFEDRLNNLKVKGDNLISQCAEHLQAKLKQNVHARLQGTKDSYSAICSAAQRVYQSLEHELQRHVSRQDTLQQCQAWLSAVQPDVKPSPLPPLSRAEAMKQVKHFRALQKQARTYLDLLCSMCDLSNSSVKTTAKDIQQTEQMIEQRLAQAQDLTQGWEEVKHMKAELWIYLQDADQQLQNMKRRHSELELNIAQNMVSQVKDFVKKLQCKQASVTAITEKVDALTREQESPEHKEISHLNDQWQDLCLQSNNLCLQREEDLQRTRDYHDCMSVVEVFLEKFTTEWDNLARSDAESTAVHLEALKKLALALQERKQAVEDLKDKKQKMIEHLNLDDRELVKEQTSHLEQRWFQLEDLVKRKIQVSVTNLEELDAVRARFQELMEWAEEQQPNVAEALQQSPPPDVAPNQLMDHLAICSDLEAKQMLLKSLTKDADRVMADLGLNERQVIQRALSDAQRHVNCLSDLVGQRRKYLNKTLSEKTQFLMAVFQATSQIQQHERKITFREHICLFPDDVSKQVKTCKSAQASLKTYQSEVSGLWAQGRDLMKGATEQEKGEVLGKLQELQSVYDTVLQKCSHRLQELEKNLVSRKHFKEDFDKACHWLKQADIVTFPEINLMNESSELQTQLAKYQHILEQSPEYENLLLTLQRTGQAILPSLNEVDHSYLNEKLNALPLQFNVIVALAKDKFYKIQEAILARKEYASLIELTTQSLSDLEDQFLKMSQVPAALRVEEALCLQDGCRALLGEVTGLGEAVDELNQKKESFRSTGQPWQPDRMLQLVTSYHRLKRQMEQRVSLLEDTTSAYQEHETMCHQLQKQLEAARAEQSKVNEETLSPEDKLKLYHALAGSLQDAGILLKRVTMHLEDLVPHLDPSAYEKAKHQIQSWQEDLKLLTSAIGATVTECESRMVQSIDFQTELSRSLHWLRSVKTELSGPVSLDLNLRDIQEEIRKVQIHQEEVQSSLRIMNALSVKEKEESAKAKELIPADLQQSLAELAELDGAIQEALRARQATLTQIYSQCQRYYQVFQAASDWLEDAHEMLQLAGNGLDVESAEENLKSHTEFFSAEDQFQSNLEELRGLVANLDPLIKSTAKEDLAQKMTSLEEKSRRIIQDSHTQLELLQRCAAQWQDYQKAREEVIELMNDAEKKLSGFSLLKTSSSHEAGEKLSEHKALVSLVHSFHEKIVALEGKVSQLEKVGNDASKATIGRSMTTVWQRWARLRAVAQDQEKILEDAVDEWKNFNNKVIKATEMIDQLQDKLPGCSAEKASHAELLTLLEHHDTFTLELEQQQSALGMLRQQALSMLPDGATPSPGEEPPVMREITALQDRCLSLQEEVRRSGKLLKQELKDRDAVETHINSVKSWVRETKEYLGNPTIEIDAQLEELQMLLTEATNHRQNMEKVAEEQKSRYLGRYAVLPSELSLQLAEAALQLGTVHDQIQDKVKQAEQSKATSQEFGRQIQKITKDLTAILTKLRAKTDNLVQAKTDQKELGEELDACNLKLVELDEAVQKFSEQNGQLGRPLTKKIGKLTELHLQTVRQAENRFSKLSQASSHLEECSEMLELILKWIDKAKILVHGKIVWNSAKQLREQYISHQTMLEESEEIHSDLDAMAEKLQSLASVYYTEKMFQQVADLGRETEGLRQVIKMRSQNLQDAAEDMSQFEAELKHLQVALEQAQATLTSPEAGRLSLKEQLSRRQHLLCEVESLKPKVHAVQVCQSALRIPEDVVTSLPLCHAALQLQEEASRLQHAAIQQCNVLQEAVMQYEHYEQEMQHLQELIEGAHREIEDKPVATSNIQELQAQIAQHEELAQKIKGYQEQIAALNSKCKMLTMKARNATMLLTVTEVEGLAEDLDRELLPATSAHPSVVMMTAGRCHTLLSPVTEESGEEGTNSEISSPPACRSPSPVANTEASVNQDIAYYGALSAERLQTDAARIHPCPVPPQDFYGPGLEPSATAKLDELQRSWETLKSMISEKQRTLYEALERQQKYQDALQSNSAKMEAIELKLSENLEPGRSPESQMAEHQALMDEILMLQDEIGELQASLAEELASESPESDPAEQLALQSTLTVLAERMSTIKMKASGKRQLLEEKLNDQLEEQRQEQALQRYRSEVDKLDHWLLSTKASLDVALGTSKEPMDMEAQLVDCQNMLVEIEQKVVALSELSVHNENLLLEGKAHTKDEAEQLAVKLRTLKGSLLELQRALHDKQLNIQGTAQEKEESDGDPAATQRPGVQDWLAQARSAWAHQRQSSLQQQKELEQELAEQKSLLRSVASRGEEILTQHSAAETSAGAGEKPDGSSQALGTEGEKAPAEAQMRVKWESLHQEFSTKQKRLQNTLEQEEQVLYSRPNRLLSGVPLYKGGGQTQDKSAVTSLLDGLNQAFEEVSSQGGGTKRQNTHLEQKLYEGVSAASTWLDGVEERLFVATALIPEETETCLFNQETLAKDIKEMSEEMDKNRNLFSQAFPENGDNRDVIEDTLGCLLGRLSLLDSVVNQRCHQMKERLQQILNFQNDLKVLFTSLADNKYITLQKLANTCERPVAEQIEAIQQAAEGLKELDAGIAELKKRGDKLQLEQPALQELSKLQDMYDELMMTIGSRRSGLNQTLALKSQYERALQDLADLLETGQEKMAGDQKMIVSSKEEVQQLLDKHKEYFQGLESHVILTETLFRKIISFAVPQETQFHAEVMAQASAVLKGAHKRGVELEYILETWSRLDRDQQELSRQLEAVEGGTPSVGLVEESEDRLADRIALYQHLKSSLNEYQPKLYQVLDDGKRLLMSISCSELESQLNQLGEHWLNNTNKVSKELHRLETILKHWTRYQSESAALIQWLQSAKDRLEFWTQQSVTVPQELEMVRDHLNAFLEFSKEVDAKSSLKSSVLSTGNQLLRLKKVDTAALRSELSHIDGQWTDLLTNIPAVQEKLHQLQMDKLPSRHAISEVMTWISLMENVIQKDQEDIKHAIGCKAINEYLQKYKGFKIDINCKQLTVDFVNQSVLQISTQDVESKRSDKTNFAEQLGAMNKSWLILQGLVAEKIQLLEGLLESWSEYENNVQCMKTWFETQEKRLKQQHRIGDQASVQNAMKDCQDLEDLIKAKEKEVEKIEQNGLALIQNKKEEASGAVRSTLRELSQTWAELDHMAGQLKILLRSVHDQWSLHKVAYDEINSCLMEARYSLSRFRLLIGSLEAVQVQVDNLQNLQDDLEKQEKSLQKFSSVTDQLLKECHPPVTETLTNTLKEVTMRWNNLLEEISEQLHSSKALLQLWRRYKDYSTQCASTVQQQADRTNELLKAATNKDIADDEVAAWIQDCNDLLKGLGAVKDSLLVLRELGEQLKPQVDASAASAIQSDQLSLSQHLCSLEQALCKQQTMLQAGVLDYETFTKSLEALEAWVVDAEEILQGQDPSHSSDLSTIQERMDELKGQMLKFSSMAPDLDRLNELGYRLPLNDKEIQRMQSLNRHWSLISSQTTERFSKLQSFLLQHQTFLEKCETWMEFLVQTEQKLAVEISGNYQHLLEQQRAHELFQAEMFSRQQVLHSIITDGQRLLEQDQVDDRDEFNLKLTLLSNQWQGVIRRAQQRRGIIDSQIRQWQRYREMAEKLRKWLVEVSYLPMSGLGSVPIPLQQARTLFDEAQFKEKVFLRQQGSYILTVEAGKQLLLSADSGAEAALQAELTDIQEKWKSASARLEEQKKKLAFLLKDWEKCENGVAESLEKLRTFKKKLSQPLPDHHEELHAEQMRCKELENAVGSWTDDLAQLTLLKDTLCTCISADDISILNERLELLQRQWEELCHQLSLRRQQVGERLNEWAVFSERNKELCEWLTQMESKVSQNGDILIEEMIEKLKKVWDAWLHRFSPPSV